MAWVEFCGSVSRGGVWERELEDGFGALTPCILNSIILTIPHLLLSSISLYKLHLLFICMPPPMQASLSSSLSSKGRLLRHYLLLFVASLLALQPVFRLALGISVVNLDGQTSLPPHEIWTLVVGSFSWCTVMFMLALEIRKKLFMKEFQWYVGFSVLYVLIAHMVMLRYQFTVRHYYKLGILMLCVGYFSCQVVFGLLYLLSVLQPVPLDGYTLLSSQSDITEQEPLTGKGSICPERRVNLISRILFRWMTPLIRLGYKRPIKEQDVWQLDSWDRTEVLYSNFQICWEDCKRHKPSLLRVLNRCLGKRFWLSGALKLGCDASQFLGPTSLNLLLQSLQNGDPAWRGYIYATLIFIGLMSNVLLEAQYFQNVNRVGFHVRSCLVAAVFHKTLRLTHDRRKDFTSGRITNLMTTDIESIQQMCGQLHGLWSAPARILLAIYLLYRQLGFAPVASAAFLLLLLPVQIVVVGKMKKFSREVLQWTDKRIGLMNEILSSVDIIKCYAWEKRFASKIQAIRGTELSYLKKANILATVNGFILQSVPVLITATSFGIYSSYHRDLTPAKAFTSISLFNIIRFPLFMIPNLITQIVNANVSLKRLQEFLNAEEHASKLNPPVEDRLPAITIKNGNFSWISKEETNTLSGIDLDIPVGSLIAIVGGTGEGKTSLISAMLDEIPAVKDAQVVVRGKVAYVPQVPWIFNGTVRDNVLFGSNYDAIRYDQAIHASALIQDLQSMPGGELTEIGERGKNISGGQKQRVSIARAVYADADVYIFDDPLSALDNHVAQQVFETCLCGVLCRKTRVLVTNQLHFLSRVDKIYLVQNGMLKEQGTYTELLAKGSLFQQLMQNEGKAEEACTNQNLREKEIKSIVVEDQKAILPLNTRGNNGNFFLVKDEERETGVISWNVLQRYRIACGGCWVVFGLVFLYISVEIFRLFSNAWLSTWTSPNSKSHGPFFYTSIYALLCLFQILATILTSLWVLYLRLRAASTLHDDMLSAIFQAPMSFFHSNPIGRIVNRFAKDTGDIDRNVASFASMFLGSFIRLLSTFALIATINTISLWTILPLLIAFNVTYLYYQSTAREIKRLDSITRSPLYTQFGEALTGMSTIRAYKAWNHWERVNADNMENNLRFTLANTSSNRWMAIRLELLGAFMVWLIATLAVVNNWKGKNGSSFAPQMGLILSYALNITDLMGSNLHLASMAENSFNAVERVGVYIDLTPEAPPIAQDRRPPADWPTKGSINFENVTACYHPTLPPTLFGISLHILPHEKVGIVGRTGAGKSTIFNVLFRIIELQSGRILIDGLDIAKIQLSDLRKSLGIIPQVPTLFSGTIQFNLDPFNEHNDLELWEVLSRSHLKDVISKSPLGLQTQVTEGGENFSVGQRQLLSLARTMLRRSKIFLLDEATAAIDVETDALIQKTIREDLKSCTMLTIAHRINTIFDCDRILVLEAGQVAEMDTPQRLLTKENSKFLDMLTSTGPANSQYLWKLIMGAGDAEVSTGKELKGRERGTKIAAQRSLQ